MYIRCRDCHGSIWIPSEEDAIEAVTAACRRCERSYVLEVSEFLRSTGERLSELARRCASDNDIDLPSAYSVLYGVLDLKEIRDLQKKSAAIHARSKAQAPAAIEFDPAFQDAVDAGLLTPAQAARRGEREEYAGNLARRHRLSPEAAYDVADNSASLLEAIRRRKAAVQAPVQLEPEIERTRKVPAIATLLLLLAGVVLSVVYLSLAGNRP